MSETYKFYVQMDGEIYGPYSAQAIQELDLLDDVLVTEESMNGQWLPATKFDFDDMVRKEVGSPSPSYQQTMSPTPKPIQTGGYINPDGSVTNPSGWQPQPQYHAQSQPVTSYNSEDDSSPVGWCILAFIIPLVGWILYFSWRRTKPKKASAVCTWAWIGFILNLIGLIAGA